MYHKKWNGEAFQVWTYRKTTSTSNLLMMVFLGTALDETNEAFFVVHNKVLAPDDMTVLRNAWERVYIGREWNPRWLNKVCMQANLTFLSQKIFIVEYSWAENNNETTRKSPTSWTLQTIDYYISKVPCIQPLIIRLSDSSMKHMRWINYYVLFSEESSRMW